MKVRPPIYLVTDRGSEYIITDISQLSTLMGIGLSHRTPYSPWTNGLVEGKNKYLGTLLRMVLQNASKDWSLQVHMHAYAHNSRRPRIPLKFVLKLNRGLHKTCISTY